MNELMQFIEAGNLHIMIAHRCFIINHISNHIIENY